MSQSTKKQNAKQPKIDITSPGPLNLYLVENANTISSLGEFKRAYVFAPSPQEAFRRTINALVEDKRGLSLSLRPQTPCTVKQIPLPDSLVFGIELTDIVRGKIKIQ